MKTRIVINKPQNKKCEICEKEISLYAFASHIKFSHRLTSDEYSSKYGEFRKPKRQKNPSGRVIKRVLCKLCNKEFPSVGMFTHLRDTHNTAPDLYTEQFGEYRPTQLREREYSERLDVVSDEEKQTCVICNKEFASGCLLGGHIKRDHLISKRDYVLNHAFKRTHPICKCGCGKNVKIMYYFPYKMEYITGHNNNGETNPMSGKKHSSESRMKMSEKAIERITHDIGKKTDTKPELEFKSILDKFQIEYIHPYNVNLGMRMASVDFYLPEIDLLVEIDGEYWHPEKLESLNFHVLPNVISDRQRFPLKNLIRLRENNIGLFNSDSTTKELVFENLLKLNKPTYTNLSYKQKVINKEFFQLCMDKKGKEYLKEKSILLLKFIRAFRPQLPYPDLEENLQDVIKKIQSQDVTRIYNQETKEFSNNISTVGHNYLKHHFHSYWDSNFNGNKSPKEAWLDDKIMQEVIDYRIGLNNSDEIFDFSLHQMIRGLSARRITISFFKPLLAAVIYKYYIGDKENSIVFDPCCGFGGRLLGFKSIYPNGKYIGCEPNIETYNELQQLIKSGKWGNSVEIYNCKLEDFTHTQNYDLIFTSIPYFDLEIYSNNTEYTSFEKWKSTFIKAIENCKKYGNCLINTTKDLSEKLSWNNIDSYILSNTTHFNKTENIKKEVIVKI